MSPHPRPDENCACPECGASEWEMKYRNLPQIGWTRVCDECDTEAFVYDAGDMPGGPYHLRPVTPGMARHLLFRQATGEYPIDIHKQYRIDDLTEAEALDYHATEKAGLSQSEWADGIESVSQQAVSKNVRRAKDKLS